MTTSALLSERLFGALIGAAELLTVQLGRELGLYAALRDGPHDPAGLAAAAGIDERYAREWLEQQAAAGFLTADDGVFALPPGAAGVLLDEDGPDYAGAAAEFALGAALLGCGMGHSSVAMARAYPGRCGRDGGAAGRVAATGRGVSGGGGPVAARPGGGGGAAGPGPGGGSAPAR
jgi:hypothetical protein